MGLCHGQHHEGRAKPGSVELSGLHAARRNRGWLLCGMCLIAAAWVCVRGACAPTAGIHLPCGWPDPPVNSSQACTASADYAYLLDFVLLSCEPFLCFLQVFLEEPSMALQSLQLLLQERQVPHVLHEYASHYSACVRLTCFNRFST